MLILFELFYKSCERGKGSKRIHRGKPGEEFFPVHKELNRNSNLGFSQGYITRIPVLNFAVLMNLRISFEQGERHDLKHLLSTYYAVRK